MCQLLLLKPTLGSDSMQNGGGAGGLGHLLSLTGGEAASEVQEKWNSLVWHDNSYKMLIDLI